MFASGVVLFIRLGTLSFNKGRSQMARTHGNKEFAAVVREIERIGFKVEQTKRGVYKIYPPLSIGGRMYTTHGTPKAMKAIKSEFRKIYGIDLSSI